MKMIDIPIQGLDDALRKMGTKQLKPAYREAWDANNPRDGFCYVIAEVIFHYLNPGGFTPRVVKWDNGTTHWFLANDAGDIIDPGNLDPCPGDDVIYAEGKPKHFLTKDPSKRAKDLADSLGLVKAQRPGKYPATIVVRNLQDGSIREYYSQIPLEEHHSRYKQGKHRYYQRDAEGFYFIPGLETKSV